MTVRTETGGIVVEVLVREGSRISKGDVLARLRDFDKQQRISELTGDLAIRRSELALLRAGARPEELERKEKLIDTRRVELGNAGRKQEQPKFARQLTESSRRRLSNACWINTWIRVASYARSWTLRALLLKCKCRKRNLWTSGPEIRSG